MTRLVQATSSIIWVKCDSVIFSLDTVAAHDVSVATVAARDVFVPTVAARDVSVLTVAARVRR